jgi:hypothetical protein
VQSRRCEQVVSASSERGRGGALKWEGGLCRGGAVSGMLKTAGTSLHSCQQETPPRSAHPTSATTSPPRGGPASSGPPRPLARPPPPRSTPRTEPINTKATSGVVGLTVLQPKFLEQFPDVRFHFKSSNLAQRGTFKGVWLNAERTEWTLQKLLQGEE